MRHPTSGFIWALTLASALALVMSATMAQAGDLEDGVAAFNAKNYEKALPLLESAAGTGAVEAQGLLARMYYNGWGAAKNRTDSLKWARLAAAQGSSEGQSVLGFIFRFGEVVPQDYVEAVKWFRLGAAQGNPRSQRNLGLMYRDGLGVEKNYEDAIKWNSLAAAHCGKLCSGQSGPDILEST